MILFIKNNYDEMSSMGYEVFNGIDHLTTGHLEVYVNRSELIVAFDPDYDLLLALKQHGSNPNKLFVVLSDENKNNEARDCIIYRYAKTIIRCKKNESPFVFDTFLSLMNNSECFGTTIIDMKEHFKSDSEVYFEYVIGDITQDKINSLPIRGNVKSLQATIFYAEDILFSDVERWFGWLHERLNATSLQASYMKNTIPSLPLSLGLFLSLENAS